MKRPPRRMVLAALAAVGAMIAFLAIVLVWQGKRAYDNVNAMIVPTLVLPTVSAPQATPEDAPAATATPPRAIITTPTVPPTVAPTAIPAPDGPVNILLLGTDARPGDELSRTDTMIVVHIDPRTDHISMLSLPRDLLVNVPQFGSHTINAAYPIGEKRFGKGYGAALAKETVADLLDIKIDYFMMVNFDGFQTLIERMDGIYVDVPKTIDDYNYPVDAYEGDTRVQHVHFDKGRQLLDGERALIYARTRHADNDFGRIQRQQQVLMAVFSRVREQGLLTQITSLDDYTDALRDYVRTDMPRSTMLSLASMGPRLNAENIARFALRPPLVAERAEPYALLLVDPQGLRKIVDQMVSGSMAAGGEGDTMTR